MMEKELAQATKLAEQANKKVAQLRKKLLAETEKAHARAKRELSAARSPSVCRGRGSGSNGP